MGSIFDKLHNININVAGDVIDLRGGTYNKGCTIINQPSQPSPKPQHIEEAEIVEEVKDIAQHSPQPTQAPPTRTLESFASMFTFGYYERRKNDFENMLALIQEPQWEPKDRARFALAIYKSDNLMPKTKPNTFKEWYQICCETFGWEQGNYEPRKLTDNKATQQIKAYL